MKKTGFYIIKDKFFEDMADPYLKGNKAGNRPHYYCFEDANTGIYWMIPLFSQIDKYKRIVEKKEKAGKPCDIIHIVKLDDSRQSAFLIQVMAVGSSSDIWWQYIVKQWEENVIDNFGIADSKHEFADSSSLPTMNRPGDQSKYR